MTDYRNDPNFRYGDGQHYDQRVQWAAVAVILLLLGGLIVAAAWTGGDTRTASNSPAVETTGAGAPMGAAQNTPATPRLPRH
jgi:hypothetical protein